MNRYRVSLGGSSSGSLDSFGERLRRSQSSSRSRAVPWWSLLLAALLLLAPLSLAAEEMTGSFSGSFKVGFRNVDVGGSENKYKEDYNIGEGPRLFDLRLELVPELGARNLADEITVDIANFGGDAFETMGLAVRKFGSYDLRYDRRKSSYFYNDIILLPAQANVRESTGGDFHTFNFDRVRDTASLKIDLSKAAKLTFGFDRFVKTGDSTTTLDIQRDEFELDKPIEEDMTEYQLGFEYAWDKVTLILDERRREYENIVEIFLPGFSAGENPPPNPASLDFIFFDRPYDFVSYDHTLRLIARPTKRFLVQAAATLQDLDMDIEASERSQGRTFAGQPFTTNLRGEGGIERDLQLLDFDMTYRINDRFALTGSVFSRSLEQEGEFVFGNAPSASIWEIDTNGGEIGAQFLISTAWSISGGVRVENRDVEEGAIEGSGEPEAEEEPSTEATGYFATLAFRPNKHFNFSLEAENLSYDDPFTLISPTDNQRIRLRGQYKTDGGWGFSAAYTMRSIENDDSNWESDQDQADLRVSYKKGGLTASLGYAFVDINRDVDQRVVFLPANVRLIPLHYEANSDFIDGHLYWKINDRFAFGSDCRLYDNSGTFALTRDDLRGYVDVGLGDYTLTLGYRTVDYNEDRFNFDDYDADILELAIGYRW